MKPNPYLIDDENPEWTREDFKNARPASDFFTPEQLASLEVNRLAYRAKNPDSLKFIESIGEEEDYLEEQKRVSLTLDTSIITHFKATGKGWQQRINDALKKELSV